MTDNTEPHVEFWDRKAATAEFSTPVPLQWLASIGLDKATARILDAGCGQGRVMQSLASSGWTGLWGVDYSPEMVRVAEKKLKTLADVQCASLENLPFSDASFDLILCFGVINTIANDHELRSVLQELSRVAADRAVLLVNDYGLGTAEFDRTRYLEALPETGVYGRFKSEGYVFQHRPVVSLIELLKGCFDVERVEELSFTTMTGRKREGYQVAARRSDDG